MSRLEGKAMVVGVSLTSQRSETSPLDTAAKLEQAEAVEEKGVELIASCSWATYAAQEPRGTRQFSNSKYYRHHALYVVP